MYIRKIFFSLGARIGYRAHSEELFSTMYHLQAVPVAPVAMAVLLLIQLFHTALKVLNRTNLLPE